MILDIFWLLVKLIIYPVPAQLALLIILLLVAYFFSKIHAYVLIAYQILLYFITHYFYAFLGYYYFLTYKSVSDPNANNIFTWIFILVIAFFISAQMKSELRRFIEGTKKSPSPHTDAEILKMITKETYQTTTTLMLGAGWISKYCFILFTIFPKLPIFLFGDIHVLFNSLLY